jgi:hypothetical protein
MFTQEKKSALLNKSEKSDDADFLKKLLKNRKVTKIKNSFSGTLYGSEKDKVRELPELIVVLDKYWQQESRQTGPYIERVHLYSNAMMIARSRSRPKFSLSIKVQNNGLTPAYNPIVEIYATPLETIARGAVSKHNTKFTSRRIVIPDTIFPGQEVSIDIIGPSSLVLQGLLFEPYFISCYDVLLDPKVQVNLNQDNDLLEEYLSSLAMENRKLLYIKPYKFFKRRRRFVRKKARSRFL